MSFFKDLSNRVWNFVSPRKTIQRRDKPFKVPAVPLKTKLAKDVAMTPQTKVGKWKVQTPASASSVDDTLLPLSPPFTDDAHNDDLEGDTLIHESVETVPKETADFDWDANENTMVVDDGQYMDQQKSMDREKERARQELQARELRDAGWPEDAVFLFQKLGMRGFEPLMPDDWINDFPTLPVDLFTHSDDKAFIKTECNQDFRAQHALEQLFNLGPFARDAVLTKAPVRTAEYHIRQSVKKYNQWALKDSGLTHIWNKLSLFQTVICDKNTEPYIAERRMMRRLRKLHNQWNEAFDLHNRGNSHKPGFVPAPEEVPTLYGVIASHTVMAFVSYVPPVEEGGDASLRMIAMFDFSEEGYDVWNSLAIAIFVIHCRNRIKELKEFLPEPVIPPVYDPDL